MKHVVTIDKYIIKPSNKSNLSKTKERLFSVVYLLSKSQSSNVALEKISIIFQLFQLLVFSFNYNFSPLWKQDSLFQHISLVIKYFQIVPFFENNLEVYFLVFYSCTILILFLIISLAYYFITKNQNESIVISFLRYLIPFVTIPLYLPIIILFTSILSCNENKNTYVEELICWQGLHFLHGVIGIIMAVIFISFSYIFIALDMNSNVIIDVNNQDNTKTSSSCDIVFFIGKTIIVLLFTFFNNFNQGQHWIMIAITLFISMYVFFDYYLKRPYVNDSIMYFYFTTTSLYLWSNICLVIGKLLENSNFNGTLLLFLVGIPIIIIFIYTSESLTLETIINQQKKTGIDMLHSILKLLMMIENRSKVRSSQILFDGYVSLYEEKCQIKACPLKQFISYRDNNSIDKKILLYQHIEILYTSSIGKFPMSPLLKISFAFFLLIRMKKKNRAITELLNAEKITTSLEERFKIYKYKAMIANSEISTSGEINDEIKESIEFKKDFNQFKTAIRTVALLYIDFWTILLQSNQDNKDDLTKLNNLGKDITQTVILIHDQFTNLQRIKYNDKETILCYSDFLLNVINDKEKANYFRIYLNNLNNNNTHQSFQGETYNLNANSFSYTDEAQYFIISSQPESFGIIMNITLGLCSLFGYTKKDIIGKSYEMLLPDIFIKSHREMLLTKADELRKNCVNYISFKEIHSQRNTFAINKSKYLIPMHIIIGIIPNEQNDFSFIAKIINSTEPLSNDSIECFIMTNNDYIIQHFSPNAVSYLDLESKSINSMDDITEHIKEIPEEVLRCMMKDDDKTQDDKKSEKNIAMKHTVIKQKFNLATQITWKKSTGSDQYMMTITEQRIYGKCIGFVFKFDFIREGPGSNIGSFKSLKFINKEKTSSSHIKVEREFIPESEAKFNLDPKSMSYKWNVISSENKIKNHEKYLQYLKSEAISKINLNNANVDQSQSKDNSQSSSNEYGSEEYSNNTSNEINDEDEESIKEKHYRHDKNEENNQTKHNEDLFYKVNLSHIKLSIYDFKKKTIIEQEYEKISQVNLKMDYNYKEDSTEESETNNKPKEMIHKQEYLSSQSKDDKETSLLTNQNVIIIKQIESALQIKESQPTIIRLQQQSFIIAVLLLGLGGAFIVILLLAYQSLSQNTLIIQNIYDIILNMIFAHYYVREITLLNIDNYTAYYSARQKRFTDIQAILLDLFNISNIQMNDIITTEMPMSSNAQFIFNNKTIAVYIIQDDAEYSVKSYNLTLKAAYIESNTALFHIAIAALKDMITTNRDLHFYLRNSMNGIFTEMNALAILMVEELYLNLKSCKIYGLIPYILSPILLLVSYFIIDHAYQEVAKRKESYLEVFFEIGKIIIQTSLENCEYFNKKIQSDSINDNISAEEPMDYEQLEFNNKDINISNRQSQSKKHLKKLSKEAVEIKVRIAFLFSIIFIFFTLIFVFLWNYFNEISKVIFIYQNTLTDQINNSCIINYVREYFYDKTLPIYYINANTDYLVEVLGGVYTLMAEKEKGITENIDLYTVTFVELYKQINQGNICEYGEFYFSRSNFTCETFLHGSAQHGLKAVITAFIEELREIRNYDNIDEIFRQANGLVYNMTLYGTNSFFKNWPSKDKDPVKYYLYWEYFPIKTFNHKINLHVGAVLNYFMIPPYKKLIESMKININESLLNTKNLFFAILVTYLSFVFMFYIVIIIPFVQSLNQTIYKTKNMLKIIPGHVLYTIPNILSVLDIGNTKVTIGNQSKSHL